MRKIQKLLSELKVEGYLELGRISGVIIRAHWSALLLAALFIVGSPFLGWEAMVLGLAYFSLIVVHELGHAAIAKRFNRDVLGIDISAIHGRCAYEWRPIQIQESTIAWGGVIGQLVLFTPACLILVTHGNTSYGFLNVILVVYTWINFILMVINLAPSKGLDGAQAWKLFWKLRKHAT